MLTKHKDDVEKVARLLLEKEVITRYVLAFLRTRKGAYTSTLART